MKKNQSNENINTEQIRKKDDVSAAGTAVILAICALCILYTFYSLNHKNVPIPVGEENIYSKYKTAVMIKNAKEYTMNNDYQIYPLRWFMNGEKRGEKVFKPKYKALFEKVREGQDKESILITSADEDGNQSIELLVYEDKVYIHIIEDDSYWIAYVASAKAKFVEMLNHVEDGTIEKFVNENYQ